MAKDNVIETHGLTKLYGSRHAVDSLDLRVPRGEVFGFLGQNGAGKTTTLRLLLGLIKPTKGDVLLFGRSLARERLALLARVGALVETPAFYPFLTGRQNLLTIGRATGGVSRARVDECLDAVGLLDRGGDRYKGYSRGMKQRLGIAWAILTKPELVLLDEPLNGLDPPAILMIRRLIRNLVEKEKATVFLSSHLLHEVEMACDRVAIIEQGRLIAQDTVASLLRPDREVLEVEVDDLDAARAVAASQPYVMSAVLGESSREQAQQVRPRVLVVEQKQGNAAALNAALVGAGRAVAALVPRRRTLEELFHDRVQTARAKRAAV